MPRMARSRSSGTPIGAAGEQLRVGPDGGERRPELVGGIRDEPAEPLLGGGLGVEGRLDPAEHRVEREPQPPDLGAPLGAFHPPGQIAGGDGCGRIADRCERAKTELHDHEPERREADENGGCDEQLDPKEASECLIDTRERPGQQNGRSGARLDPRPHPVPAPTVARIDSEVGGFAVAKAGDDSGELGQRLCLLADHAVADELAGSVAKLDVVPG